MTGVRVGAAYKSDLRRGLARGRVNRCEGTLMFTVGGPFAPHWEACDRCLRAGFTDTYTVAFFRGTGRNHFLKQPCRPIHRL